MRAWLLTVGEPMPTDENGARLLRSAQFASWLSQRGIDVTFWTNSVDHYRKRQRYDVTTEVQLAFNHRVVFLHSRLYTKNVSLRRIRSHQDTAHEFLRHAGQRPAPDIIFTSYPIEELCRAAVRYAAPRGIPVVVDVRDFWPDIFADALPRRLQWLAGLPLRFMDRRARKTLASASALCSFTQSGLEWAWKKADRTGRPEDFWFPFTYRAEQSTEADLAPARAFWKRHEAFDTRYTFQVCFFGALSGRYNLEAVIDAAKQLGQRNAPISFLLCGEGEAGDQLRARASGAANVYFPGWVNGTQIRALMEVASVGILPYDNPDFLMSIPNKFVEYLAGGLPVVSCTGGEVKRLLETSGCGLWVRPDAASIAEGLAELAVNPDAVDKMHVRSRDVFKTTFEEGVVFSQALGRLEEIVRSHKTPRQDGAT